MNFHKLSGPRPLLFLALVAATACPAGAISAREYKTNDFNANVRRQARIVKDCVTQPALYNTEQEQVKQYFREYYFPVMTQVSTEDLGELGQRRFDFFRQYIWPAQNPQMQRDLTAMTQEYMTVVLADPNFHPGVRYNAILMLGLLDAEYASDRGGTQPKPLPAITELLVKIVAAAGKSSKITPDLVIGALVGLERHAQFGASLPAGAADAIESAMLGLLADDEALAELDSQVRAWTKRQAAGVLAQLGRPGTDGRVVTALVALVGDESLPYIERCQVAAMLGRIQMEPTAVSSVAKSLIQLASSVATKQAEEAREYEDLQLGGGTGATRARRTATVRRTSSGYGETIKYERRLLLAQLEYLNTALSSLEQMAEGEAKEPVTEVLAAMNSVRVMAKDDKSLDLDLTREVKRMANEIQRVAGLYNEPEESAAATAAAPEQPDERVQ
jgi:hypothetical protein